VAAEPKLIVNLTRGSVLCERATIADRPFSRMRGLVGQRSLEEGHGLLLQPAPSVHTAFMRFSIDVVFLDRDLTVLKLVQHLRPWRVASASRARNTLELATGEIDRRGIAVGEQLAVSELMTAPSHEPDSARFAGRSNGSHPAAAETIHGNVESPDGDEGLSESHATRVLLVGNDRRFRSVAAALLTRHGYAVTVGGRDRTAAELADKVRPDVVVLDAGTSLTAAARQAAQIETLDPPIGVVVVGEESQAGLSAMPVLAKWEAFDGLYGAIEHARPTLRATTNDKR
jgi:uncharacterized membrane protein (UPF0127 family)/CheY-like chemotaxis protein